MRIVTAGDSVMIAEFEERIDEAINARARALAATITAGQFAGVLDVVPTFRSVAVYFDPLRTDTEALRRKIEAGANVRLKPDATRGANTVAADAARHEIPVRYGGEDGPDLAAVARFAGLSEADVVARHTALEYRVFMLGFMPGFAYLGLLDDAIRCSRLDTPRPKIRAGSVAIAGPLTAVYPSDSPGGWRIIGTTSVRPFDRHRDEPFMFAPGDYVRFAPV
jgi:inhibitor of KinA